uniref:acyltransferase domain-containing protein n=2 Tax=unclassified Streptomyces TaxID=2593676 RepID=UPI0011B0A47F
GGALLAPLLGDPGDDGAPWPTGAAQPALYAVQCALVELWREAGIAPEVVAGHSVGEYAALTAAGALTVEDGLRITAERGRLMETRTAPGGMVAVLADRASALALTEEVPGIELAAVNGELNHVLAGPRAAVDRLGALLEERGLRNRRLPVEHAFHTALIDPVLAEFEELVSGVALGPVTVPFVSGLDGGTRPPGWAPDAAYLVRQTRRPVQFHAALRGVADRGATVLVEMGGGGLSGLARQALPEVVSVPSLRGGTGLDPLWDAAAALFRAGAPVDWHVLAEGSGGRRIPLPGYRFQHRTHWRGPAPTAAAAAETLTEGTHMTADVEVKEVLTHVVEVTSHALGGRPDAVGEDTSFLDLGADSLLMINVLRELEQTYHVKVAMRELFDEAVTPRRLAELVASRRAGGGTPAKTPAAPTPGPTPTPAPAAPVAPAAPAALVAPPLAEPAPVVAAPVTEPAPSAPAYATRQEVDDLARQIRQLSAIQLQLMEQLAELLSCQAAATATATTATSAGQDGEGR